MSWVEKNQKINNGEGDDYLGLESITKWDRKQLLQGYDRVRQKFITKCVSYYRVRQVLKSVTAVYCKVHQLLKSATSFKKRDRLLLQSVSGIKSNRLLLQGASGIVKCDSYCKVRYIILI